MKNYHHIRRTFTTQLAAQDCGQAALLSILLYYNINFSYGQLLEHLPAREGGTSILGIRDTALAAGISATCYHAGVDDLYHLEGPAILRVATESETHFIVFYGRRSYRNSWLYVIGDPAGYVVGFTKQEIEYLWQVDAALVFDRPTPNIRSRFTAAGFRDLLALHGRIPVLIVLAFSTLMASVPVYALFMSIDILFLSYLPAQHRPIWLITLFLGALTATGKYGFEYFRDRITEKFEDTVNRLLIGEVFRRHIISSAAGLTGEVAQLAQGLHRLVTGVFLNGLLLITLLIILYFRSPAIPGICLIYILTALYLGFNQAANEHHVGRQLGLLKHTAEQQLIHNGNGEGYARYAKGISLFRKRYAELQRTQLRISWIQDMIGLSLLTMAMLFFPENPGAGLQLTGGTILLFVYLLVNRINDELTAVYPGLAAVASYHHRITALPDNR